MRGVLRSCSSVVLAALAVTLMLRISEASDKVLTGTGFAVDGTGLLVTNYHVVAGCTNVLVHQNGPPVTGHLVDGDPSADLALIKITSKTPAFSVFRQSPALRAGEQAVAFGFPLSGVLASEGNLTVGYVSSLRGLRDDATRIQITTPVQPGNSGGSLLDTSGHLIGVITSKLDAIKAIRATGDVPQNVNFAVSLPTLLRFLKRHNVAVSEAASLNVLNPADIGERARAFTYLIACFQRAPPPIAAFPSQGDTQFGAAPRGDAIPQTKYVTVDQRTLKFSDIKQPYPAGAPEQFQLVISNAGKHHVTEITVGFRKVKSQDPCPTNLADYDGLKKFSVNLPSGDSEPVTGIFSAQASGFCIVKAIGLAGAEDFAKEQLAAGIAYGNSGDYERAIVEFSVVIERQPKLSLSYFYRGIAHSMMKEHSKALADFTQTIALEPTNANAHFRLGQTYFSLNDYVRALASYDKSIELKADNPLVFYYRGWVHSDRKDYAKAIADNTRAIQLNPRFAKAYNNRAWAYYLMGKSLEGLPDAYSAIENDAKDYTAYDTRAHILEALGDTKTAIADFRKAVELNSDSKMSIAGLKRLGAWKQ